MNRWYLAIFLCAAVFAELTMANSEFHIRAKRQDCKCVRNPGGGLTCSCAKPSVTPGSTLMNAEHEQQADLAHELQTIQPQQAQSARCACLQIVFHGNPQYQCQCGDGNGNPLPTTTLPATTTTTPAPTTSTTTQIPTTTTQAYEPTQGPGQCQCIMIRISGPATAQYQCACQNTPKPVTMAPFTFTSTEIPTPAPETIPPFIEPITLATPAPEPVYPPVGTINSTEQGCYCVDQMTANIQPLCGCLCNCQTMLCTIPSGVCACPQDTYGQPSPAAAEPQTTTPAFQYMPVEEPTTTLPPVMETTTLPAVQHEQQQQYPMTTTCVMYVGVQASPCMCLPQYDQCAQNICCLKAKYRSYKNAVKPMNDQPQGESTIDMLMNVLHKLKTKLNH